MAIGDIVVCFDIGTSKVSCVVGQVNKFKQIETIGYGLAQANGLRKGIIHDQMQLSQAIRQASEQAEEIAQIKIYSGYINIKGMYVRQEQKELTIDVNDFEKGITQNDINNAYNKLNNIETNENEEIVDIVITEYKITEKIQKEEPIGVMVKQFTVLARVVMAEKGYINNLVKTMKLAGMEIDGVIMETLGTSEIVLVPEEKEIGVLMLDVGASHTDISIYNEGKLIYYNTILVGGDNITNDLSVVFGINNTEAEKIKKQFNLCMCAMIDNNHEIKFSNSKNETEAENQIKCSNIVEVIEERVTDLFVHVKKEIDENRLRKCFDCCVITGCGLSSIVGVQQLAKLVIKLDQVRISNAKIINVIKPQQITAYGMRQNILQLCGEYRKVHSKTETIAEPTLRDKMFAKINSLKDVVGHFLNKNKE